MQLEMARVTFKCAHFDDTGLFEEVESEDIVANLLGVLDLPRQRMHDIDQVVALAEHFVHFGATLCEVALDRQFDRILNNLRVGLVTNLVDVLLGDLTLEARRCRLQIVQGVAHIALGRVDESLDTLLLSLKRFLLDDLLEAAHDFDVRQLREADDGTARLDRLNQLARVVAS